MPRLASVVFLVLIFTGCASIRTEAPIGNPNLVRARLIDLAVQEWRAFGGQVVLFDGGRERIDPVGLWEDSGPAIPLVAKYWRSVGKPWDGRDCDKPWSAAFISWLMNSAGVSRAEFSGGALHAEYLNAILHHQDDPGARFLLRDPSRYAPRPGDLICAPRGGQRPSRFDSINPEAPMHCDIVISNAEGKLESIGGNVRNSVSRTVRIIDASGLLASAADRPWQLVVENLYP